MFSKSAHLYDLVYQGAGKSYDTEAEHIRAVVRQRLPEALTLLDVACGTGRHLARFARTLDCTGVDLDPGFLRLARSRCPEVAFTCSDMRRMDLGRQFDVVTCLHASIGYMVTIADLRAALASMARHVRPGGLLLVEMFDGPDGWRTDLIDTVVARESGVTVVRMGTSVRRGRVATVDLHYLVGSDLDGITHLTEQHDLGLFTVAEYQSALASTGMTVQVLPPGPSSRGLLVGAIDTSSPRMDPTGGQEVAGWVS